MALLSTLFLSFLLVTVLSLYVPKSAQSCRTSCPDSGFPVRFPFGVNSSVPNNRCSYPGFGLSCNNQDRAILSIPKAGQFVVQSIDYEKQQIQLHDPDLCLAKGFLDSFDLSESPFTTEFNVTVSFYSCSPGYAHRAGMKEIGCLGGNNRTVIAVREYYDMVGSCLLIKTVTLPDVWWLWLDDTDAMRLEWKTPDCRTCERRGGTCGFRGPRGLAYGCYNLPSKGLPRSAKYGIIIGVGIPGLLCLIGLSCYVCGIVRAYGLRGQRRPGGTEFSTSVTPQPAVVIAGLDRPTIESYPKTLLGESRRLPNPNDNTCPICLSNYQPKEALRTIPECNHYFHADCIDEWLRMNSSCPLCRNSPGGSALVTPSTSLSSSSSSLASL